MADEKTVITLEPDDAAFVMSADGTMQLYLNTPLDEEGAERDMGVAEMFVSAIGIKLQKDSAYAQEIVNEMLADFEASEE